MRQELKDKCPFDRGWGWSERAWARLTPEQKALVLEGQRLGVAPGPYERAQEEIREEEGES